MVLDPYDHDREMYEDLLAEARAERDFLRRCCPECGYAGGYHPPNCPGAPDEDDEGEAH